MKRIYIISVLLLLTLSGYGINLPDFPFVYVKGAAKKSFAPDLAYFEFELTVKDRSYKSGFEDISEKAERVLAYLRTKESSISDLIAFDIKMDRTKYDGKYTGYYFTRDFRFVLTDLNSYSDILDMLYDVEEIEGLRINFNLTKAVEYNKELIKEAIENAKERANEVASQVGRKVSKVYSVSDVDFDQINSQLLRWDGSHSRIGYLSSSSGGSNYVIPQTITLHKNIYVMFEFQDIEE